MKYIKVHKKVKYYSVVIGEIEKGESKIRQVRKVKYIKVHTKVKYESVVKGEIEKGPTMN